MKGGILVTTIPARQLTEKQKDLIWQAIEDQRTVQDREPREVINSDYQGNENQYLLERAEFLGVKM